jgi:GT2 family glycosyltransferase
MIGYVIPAYNAPQDLERCMDCILKQGMPFKVHVHDNSIDNIYFTAAVNKGIKQFLAEEVDYICVLNQDCFLEPRAMKKLIETMQSNPDIGIVTTCNKPNDDTIVCIDTGGLWAIPSGGSERIEEHKLTEKPVLWATAACWLLRPEMIQEIGLLDENLVHFCSDVDYCFTARARGWEVWRSTGIGVHAPKSLELSEELMTRKQKDLAYFIKKWCGGLYDDLSFDWQKPEQIISVFKRGKRIEVNNG